MKRNTIWPLIGLLVGTALLLLQLRLTIPARMATGASLPASIVFYFSFFTILTNIGVVATYLSALTDWTGLIWFRRHQTRTMFAVLIFIVMLVYHFVLAGIWQPQGLFKVADIGLHYAAPLMYIGWWVILPRGNLLNFSQISVMMVPALLYIAYALIRGSLTGLYPYPFIDANELGYAKVVANALGLFIITAALMAIFIGIDRRLANYSQK